MVRGKLKSVRGEDGAGVVLCCNKVCEEVEGSGKELSLGVVAANNQTGYQRGFAGNNGVEIMKWRRPRTRDKIRSTGWEAVGRCTSSLEQ